MTTAGGTRIPIIALFVCALAIGASWPWALVAAAAGCAAWTLARRLRGTTAARLVDRSRAAAAGTRPAGRPLDRLPGILDEARRTIGSMRGAAAGLADTWISGTALSFCEGAEHLVDELARKPSRVGQARQFLTYYLDAARNIVVGYARLEGRQGLSPEARTTLAGVAPALRDMTGVLQQQVAGLLSDDAFDLDVELSLLRTTMALDGLVDADRQRSTPSR